MLASFPASILNQSRTDLGIPNRFSLKSSRFRSAGRRPLSASSAPEPRELHGRALGFDRLADLPAEPGRLRSEQVERAHWVEQDHACEHAYRQHQLAHDSLHSRDLRTNTNDAGKM